ncbi:hypothetical protein FQR65_LT05944 [Abscondita terminalis]|nr:hypothetical protein FQR65_LT05944 [Abscondita terminalis]
MTTLRVFNPLMQRCGQLIRTEDIVSRTVKNCETAHFFAQTSSLALYYPPPHSDTSTPKFEASQIVLTNLQPARKKAQKPS